MDSISIGIVVTIVIIATVNDVRFQKIPNLLTFPSMAIALAYHGFFGQGIAFASIGLGVGIGVFLIPHLMGGMGAGDVKLMGAIGAFIGWKGIFFVAIIAAFAGLFYALGILICNRDFAVKFISNYVESIKAMVLTQQPVPIVLEMKNKPRLYYGIPIAIGAMSFIGMKFFGYNFLNMI